MKKFSVLIALALLAVAGTGYAVTCAQDNVPAATLLVPYFRVAAPVDPATGNLGAPTVDTLCAITNVSGTGLIAHVTVWNKYSKAVFDFNIPLSGFDVASWKMSALLNGALNVNPLTQDPAKVKNDLCGLNLAIPAYVPKTGFGKSVYIRFPHSDWIDNTAANFNGNADYARSISIYAVPNAFGSGSFRPRVWDSLDESGDVSSFTSSSGSNILDVSNPVCVTGTSTPSPTAGTAFSGYVTIDVVNYCTNFFPDQPDYYQKDAIATTGWLPFGYTPNSLMGDVFYVDGAANTGNISGDPMVQIEFDSRLNDCTRTVLTNPAPKTFYGKFVEFVGTTNTTNDDNERGLSCLGANVHSGAAHDTYAFAGDGREPLAEHYGFRYMNVAPTAQTWITVWRSAVYLDNVTLTYNQVNLCQWWLGTTDIASGARGFGLWDVPYKIIVSTFDEDEGLFAPSGQGCPSGDPACVTNPNELYIFLESSRIALAGNTAINPQLFPFGWVDMTLFTNVVDPVQLAGQYWNMGYVGVQHTAAGQFVSVGHSATVLDGMFLCEPTVNVGGSTYFGAVVAGISQTVNGITYTGMPDAQ